jgi:nicotinamidase-related amidase
MNNTALLVMDIQAGILANYPNKQEIVAHIQRAVAHARKQNIPVIYVVAGFRPGAIEMSANNKLFAQFKDRLATIDPTPWMKIDDGVKPLDNETIVIKRRISAFSGSDLEWVLRAQNIRHLVLTGLAASGVVLSTTREAADKDFQLTVLSDGCADPDPEVHRVLTEKVFVRQADVMTINEWINK